MNGNDVSLVVGGDEGLVRDVVDLGEVGELAVAQRALGAEEAVHARVGAEGLESGGEGVAIRRFDGPHADGGEGVGAKGGHGRKPLRGGEQSLGGQPRETGCGEPHVPVTG